MDERSGFVAGVLSAARSVKKWSDEPHAIDTPALFSSVRELCMAIDALDRFDESNEQYDEYNEYTCWVCDAIAKPIYDGDGNVVGSSCSACAAAER